MARRFFADTATLLIDFFHAIRFICFRCCCLLFTFSPLCYYTFAVSVGHRARHALLADIPCHIDVILYAAMLLQFSRHAVTCHAAFAAAADIAYVIMRHDAAMP